jgi:hypothetical protein
MDKVFRECGTGWSSLIDPLEKRCDELGGLIYCIKEKYAGLRFYYDPGGNGTESEWDAFEEAVDQAEADSKKICEMCGKAGKVMRSGQWYKTVCAEHAIELGYKEIV